MRQLPQILMQSVLLYIDTIGAVDVAAVPVRVVLFLLTRLLILLLLRLLPLLLQHQP